MQRYDNWEERLIDYLASIARIPMQPSVHDCAHFGAGAIKAMTGEDLVPEWGRDYTTLKDGVQLLRKHGFRTHVDYVANFLKEIQPPYANIGDIGIVPGDVTGGAIGVVQGEGVYVLTPAGLSTVSRLHMRKAFQV